MNLQRMGLNNQSRVTTMGLLNKKQHGIKNQTLFETMEGLNSIMHVKTLK